MKNKNVKTTVAALIIKNNRILLEKRNNQKEKGKWCLPGGHIELGETALEAIKRETKEELGLNTNKLKFLGYFDEIIPKIDNYAIVLVYKAEVSGKIKMQKEEVSDVGGFTKKEVEKLDMAFHHKEIIKKFWRKK